MGLFRKFATRSSARPVWIRPSAVALALIVCGATDAGADGNRIPGVYDPATKTFRLYPIPRAPAGASAAGVKVYHGTLKITAKLYLNVPDGTTINSSVEASVSDYAGNFDNYARKAITASGKTATVEFSIPYATPLGDPSDKVTIQLSINATYQNKDGVEYNPSGLGSTTIPLPKDGAVTKVTVAAGV